MYRSLITAVVLFLVMQGNVRSQATISAQAFAEVIEALSANETNQLHFGRFATEEGGGNIIITPAGERSSEGSVVLVNGPAGQGQFQVTGFPEATVTIQLPEAPAVLIHQGSNKTMFVDNWVSDPPTGNGPTVLEGGSATVSVGATLSVGSYDENPVGIYAGTFQLTFAYN
jgi:hypothetical protein